MTEPTTDDLVGPTPAKTVLVTGGQQRVVNSAAMVCISDGELVVYDTVTAAVDATDPREVLELGSAVVTSGPGVHDVTMPPPVTAPREVRDAWYAKQLQP